MNFDTALWALGRGTGIVALVIFTLTMVLGVLTRSGRAVPGVGRFGVADLHRTAALTGVGLIVAHVGSLLLDPYAQLRLVDVVLPFLGAYKPIWLGLGTLAVDILVVVTVVSLLRHKVGPKVFHLVHLSTWALWPIAVLHTLGNGSNSGSRLMIALVVACAVAVGGALTWRLLPSYAERGRDRTPRKVQA